MRFIRLVRAFESEVSAEALPTSYLNGIEQQSRKVAGRVLQRVDNEPVIGANIVDILKRWNHLHGFGDT